MKGTYTTYKSWLAAAKKAGAVRLDGDKDIAMAFDKNGRGVAEWDGAEGYIYKVKSMIDGSSVFKNPRDSFGPYNIYGKEAIRLAGEYRIPMRVDERGRKYIRVIYKGVWSDGRDYDYSISDYFDQRTGQYLGPDRFGVEPVWKDYPQWQEELEAEETNPVKSRKENYTNFDDWEVDAFRAGATQVIRLGEDLFSAIKMKDGSLVKLDKEGYVDMRSRAGQKVRKESVTVGSWYGDRGEIYRHLIKNNPLRPRKGESSRDFVSRCMSEEKMSFPEPKQRIAVCLSKSRKRNPVYDTGSDE